MSDADALEAAIRADPDAVLPWAVYADYLAERGDPRGEFMHVQLALEDARLTGKARAELAAREAELLAEHGAGWLGGLMALMGYKRSPRGNRAGTVRYNFRRGWLSNLAVDLMTPDFATALNHCHDARFLRRLEVTSDGSSRGESSILAGFPYWSGVRELHLGHPVGEDLHLPVNRSRLWHRHADSYLRQMPALESLTLICCVTRFAEAVRAPMPRLRRLHLRHGDSYPLEELAANSTITRLTHLVCRPRPVYTGLRDIRPTARVTVDDLRAVCDANWPLELLSLPFTEFGDEGAHVLAQSNVWQTLRTLDLSVGCITDDGACGLVRARGPDGKPALSRLTTLDLSRNAMTPAGVAAIRAVMPSANLADQHDDLPTSDPNAPPNYLIEGDWGPVATLS